MLKREISNTALVNAFIIILTALCLIYSVVLPPLCAPDEPAHFATAYRYSNMILGKSGGELITEEVGLSVYSISMRSDDAALFSETALVSNDADNILYLPFKDEFALVVNENSPVDVQVKITPYIFIVYLPAIIGITLARIFGLSAAALMMLARIFTFLTSCALVYLAVKRIPVARLSIMMCCLLPMTLHLFASCSADSLTLALAFFAFSQMVTLKYSKHELTYSSFIPLAVSCAILSSSKPMYIVFALLILFIPVKRFSSASQRKRVIGLFISCVVITWLAVYAVRMMPALTQSITYNDVAVNDTSDQAYSVGYTLTHPLQTLGLIAYSVISHARVLVFMLIGNRLGHLSVPVPSAVVLVCAALLLFSIIPTKNDAVVRISKRMRIALICIFVLTVVICYYGMMLWWTPTSSDTILGVQGRYFLPVFPLICFALRLPLKKKFSGEIWLLAVSALANIYALCSVFTLLNSAV